jgi:hypothetical protein
MVGVGFFFGTINRLVQFYNPSIAQTFSGLFFFGAASMRRLASLTTGSNSRWNI